MSVRISRGWPGLRSGYDQTNPLPPTRKSKPSLSISSTPGRASARRRTSSASAIQEPPRAWQPHRAQARPWHGRPVLASVRFAELVLVSTTGGAAHILVRVYGPPAARAHPPAGVQFVAFEVDAGVCEVLLGILHVMSGLDAGQRKVNAFGRVVATWRLVLHCRPAFCCAVTVRSARPTSFRAPSPASQGCPADVRTTSPVTGEYAISEACRRAGAGGGVKSDSSLPVPTAFLIRPMGRGPVVPSATAP